MAILNSENRRFLKSVAKVSHANPFLAERIDLERKALGSEFDESHANWNLLGDDPETHQINTRKIAERAYAMVAKIQQQLKKGVAASGILFRPTRVLPIWGRPYVPGSVFRICSVR